MPLRNRVTPLGEIVAHPARGLVYGNRGCLHDAEGRIRRAFAVRRWIARRLEVRGRRRTPKLQPGRFTELFFLDEATAFAAGHRPCAECRRERFREFAGAWAAGNPHRIEEEAIGAAELDEQLNADRLIGRAGKSSFRALAGELPDGTM